MAARRRVPVPRAVVDATATPGEIVLGQAEGLVVDVVPGQRIALAGRVDAGSVADLRLALQHAVDSGTDELVVDVERLELGDATGLGALLGAHRRAVRVGRTLVLANVPAPFARLLHLTRLARVLHVREDRAETA